ncbi:hypothetical protein EW145_g3001 [Phellinidium pouzarii]|uniref:Serine hydrolase domain-containing protein n=1 Tax=Phellinidium pouzarii TaxID=167371 RepID=A0A4S4L978_9AGAM|nr:hypothetical protein EW145_g3001 [Phellinidium pouzarii]
MTTRKVLMLHGYSQNAATFLKRIGAVRKACGKDIDFVFIDAPNILYPSDLAGISTNALGAAEVSTKSQAVELDPAEIPRGWWKSNPEATIYEGVAESLEVLKAALIKDKFEGVFGFSQGAAMAALLAAVLERPHLHQPFLVDGQSPHPPLKFCVAVSGFKALDARWAPFFSPGYTTPTLHVLGLNDVVVVPERSRSLIAVSTNSRIATHDGGHFVPSKTLWRNFFRDYLKDPLGDVPLPPSSSSLDGTPVTSAPGSGAATPVEATASLADEIPVSNL